MPDRMPDRMPAPQPDPVRPSIEIATLSHRPEVLEANLRRSPCVAEGVLPLTVIPDAPTASEGNNRALDSTRADIVVLAHHDVYLPRGWEAVLQQRIAEVTAIDPDWGLIGAFGMVEVEKGYGPVWSSSLGMIVGRVGMEPLPVLGFDELLVVVRRASGLRFDEGLPGYHLWGTDIVAEARARGKGAWVCPLPLVHNDGFHEGMDASFITAYRYLQRKWRDRLPLRSPITYITRSGLTIYRWHWKNYRSRAFRMSLAQDPATLDPQEIAWRCGWADLRPGPETPQRHIPGGP